MLVRVQICREPDTVLALKYSLISLLAPLIYFSRTSAGSDSVHTHYKVRCTDNTYVSLFFPTGTGLERLRAVRNCHSLCASALVSWDPSGGRTASGCGDRGSSRSPTSPSSCSSSTHFSARPWGPTRAGRPHRPGTAGRLGAVAAHQAVSGPCRWQ